MAAPPAMEALHLVAALRAIGARAVEREGDRVVALFPAPPEVEALVKEARRAIRTATTVRTPQVAWRWQSSSDLEARWRAEHPPRRVGRLLIAPTGVDPTGARGEDLVLRLEPGVAFGTAEHATTRACLRFLANSVRGGDRVLDLGTGSGILAIAAALLGAGRVLAVDADPLACDAARRNVTVNGVGRRVRVRRLEVGARDLGSLGRHDVVAANLQAPILLSLMPGLAGALRREGWLVLSGVVGEERTGVVAAARSAGLSAVEEATEGGWWTGLLRAASSLE